VSQRVALIAGVERYHDPTIRSLTCVDSDCARLDRFLRYRANFDHVRLLRGGRCHEILDVAASMASRLSAGDLLLFYFSGHGVEHNKQHLLLCRNARLNRLEYFQEVVPVDLLRKETETAGVRRVLILDACRSELLHHLSRESSCAGRLRPVPREVVCLSRSRSS
jgi:hypothetical protein